MVYNLNLMRMRNYATFLLFMLCFLCAGCSSEKESPIPETPKIELPSGTDTKPVVSQQGGTSSVTFTATAEWTASAVTRAVDWLSVSPTHGSAGTVNLQITLQPNDTYDERNAAILLTCGTTTQTITVTQKQKDALLVSSNKVEIEAQESSFTLEWQANVPVSYTIEESAKGWLTPSSSTRGLTTSSMKFQAAENQDTESRQAVITLQGNGLTEQVKVYQAGSKPSIVLSQKDYAVSAEGGEIQVELKSNVAYKVVMPEVSWITENSTRAVSTYTHRFTVAANEGYDARSAEITFINEENGLSEKVSVVQTQKNALLVSSNKIEMAALEGTFTLEWQANVPVSYTIEESAQGWLTASSSTRGLTTSSVQFHVTENLELESRQAIITLQGNDLTEQVTVYQMGSKPSIVLSQKDYAVSTEGGSIQVELKSNVAYKVVMPEVSWITESSTRATSTYTHHFTVAANEGYDARSAEIAFVNEENGLREKVTVTQAQKDAIVVAQEQYTVQATGGQLQISVQANVAFDVSINVDWMRKAAETRGLTDRALTFAIDENKAKTSREAKITLKAGRLSQEIKVLQEGKTQTDGGIDDIPVEPW